MIRWGRWRPLLGIGLGLALAGLLVFLLSRFLGSRTSPPPSAPTVRQVQALADLVTLHVPLADVQVSQIHGYLGGVSLVLVVKGEADLGTDLNQARFVSVDSDHRRAVVVLPPPRVLQACLDHPGTRIFRLDRHGLWHLLPGSAPEAAMVDRALAQAQDIIQRAADQPDLQRRAREQAERVLSHAFEPVGWQVEVRWSETPNSTTQSSGVP